MPNPTHSAHNADPPPEPAWTVLTRRDGTYAVHGEFGPGETATSVLLPGFAVTVGEAFAARA